MTQEDKDLLLKYLCMALPYGVKISTPTIIGRQDEIRIATAIHKFKYYSSVCGDNFGWDNIEWVKPYLRPMSSMTEEEIKEFTSITENVLVAGKKYTAILGIDSINWLLENYFDFMGLIPKGLAIEVTETNNPYKE